MLNYTFNEWFGFRRQLSGNVNVKISPLSFSWRIVQLPSAIHFDRLVFSIIIYFPCSSHSVIEMGPLADLRIVVRASSAIERKSIIKVLITKKC